MTITAKRFTVLGEETNIGTADFLSNNSSEIFNSSNNELKTISSDMEEFLMNLVEGNTKPSTSGTETSESGINRISKELSGGIRDITKLNTKAVDNAIAGMLPDNPALQSAFRQISSQCKNKALTPVGYGKPFDASLTCGGNTNSTSGNGCDTAQFSNLLSRLTNGQYNSTYNDLNAVLNNLIALSNYGYDMNMCGVFSALSTGIGNTNVLNRGSAVLLGSLSSAGNTLGILDLSSASAGLTPVLENPSGISSMFSNYNTPKNITENGFSSFTDRVLAAATIFDSNWDTSKADGIISTAQMGKHNKGMDDILTSKVLNNVADEDNLNTVFSSDTDFLRVAYAFG